MGDLHIDRNTITPPVTNTSSIAISAVGLGATICGSIDSNVMAGNPSAGTAPQWGIEISSVGPATTSLENNTFTNVAAPFFIAHAVGVEISNNTMNNFGQDAPYFSGAYNEESGYNGTEWIGSNTQNGSTVVGWSGHTYGAQPTVCPSS